MVSNVLPRYPGPGQPATPKLIFMADRAMLSYRWPGTAHSGIRGKVPVPADCGRQAGPDALESFVLVCICMHLISGEKSS